MLRAAPARRRTALAATAVGIGVLAAAVRLVLVLRGGGLFGVGNYDDGVYFGAADALVHGRLPYRDFLFLQPPGVLVVLAPFAALGRLVGDAHAFALARVAGYLLAGGTTALLVWSLRRVGVVAGVVAGLLYALVEPAVFSSRSTLLEPIGAFAMAAVLAVLGGGPLRRRASDRAVMLVCGVLLGVAIAVKIWAIVPAAIFLVAVRRRRPLWFAGGIAGSLVLLLVPFLVAAPTAMWRQVVLDQLGRPRFLSSVLLRLAVIVQAPPVSVGRPLVTVLVLAVVAALAAVAFRQPIARLAAVQLAAAIALLLATPSFFDHYAALATPFLAIVVGAGAGCLVARVRTARLRLAAGAGAAALVIAYCLAGWLGTGAQYMLHPPVGAALVARLAPVRGCVLTDDPGVLVLTDRLSRDLEQGCPFWPDLTGWELDADRVPRGAPTAPMANAAFQARMARYLTSGDAAVLDRAPHRLTAATLRALGPIDRVERGRFLVTTTPR